MRCLLSQHSSFTWVAWLCSSGSTSCALICGRFSGETYLSTNHLTPSFMEVQNIWKLLGLNTGKDEANNLVLWKFIREHILPSSLLVSWEMLSIQFLRIPVVPFSWLNALESEIMRFDGQGKKVTKLTPNYPAPNWGTELFVVLHKVGYSSLSQLADCRYYFHNDDDWYLKALLASWDPLYSVAIYCIHYTVLQCLLKNKRKNISHF